MHEDKRVVLEGPGFRGVLLYGSDKVLKARKHSYPARRYREMARRVFSPWVPKLKEIPP